MYGSIHLYQTGEKVRPATREELMASLEAGERDGDAGVFYDSQTGCSVYVMGEDLQGALDALRREALAAGDSEQAELCRRALTDDREALIECIRAMQD